MMCPTCDDVGHREGEWCDCPAADRARESARKRWDWLLPHVQRHEQLMDEEADEEAEELRRRVLG